MNGTPERPWQGPVVLLFSTSFWETKTDLEIPEKPSQIQNTPDLSYLLPQIQGRRVSVVLGGAIDTHDKIELARELSRKWSVPFVHTWKGKGIIPDDWGMIGSLGLNVANYVTMTSDLVLEIGMYAMTIETQFYYNRFGYVIEDDDRILFSRVQDPRPTPRTTQISLTAEEALRGLLALDLPPASHDWIQEIETFDIQTRSIPRNPIPPRVWSTEKAMSILASRLENSPVITGTGNHWYSAGKWITPRKWLSWTNWASIGCGYPVGFGYTWESPSQPTWIVEGDGGMFWNLSSFMETVKEPLRNRPIRIVLIRDREYGAVLAAYDIKKLPNPQGASLKHYDGFSIQRFVENFGIPYISIQNESQFIRTVDSIRNRPGIVFLDVQVDNNSVYEINLDQRYRDALLTRDIDYLKQVDQVYVLASADPTEK